MPKDNNQAAPIGFEDQLWRAAEDKHVVLGLIFLRLHRWGVSWNNLT
jgi:hypothetical protein